MLKRSVPFLTLLSIATLAWLGRGHWFEVFLLTTGPVLIFIAWARWKRHEEWCLLPALMQAVYNIYWSGWWLGHSSSPASFAPTYDLYLFFVDGSVGFEPSLAVRSITNTLHLNWFFRAVYVSLSIALSMAYIAHLRYSRRLKYIPVVLAAALSGVLLYQIVPACGPAYFLGAARFNTGHCGALCVDLSNISLVRDTFGFKDSLPRNCMPSLHVTWAILIFWVCRDLRFGKWIAAAFAVCTVISTLAVGEHYLVDLVPSFPFALLIWSLCVGGSPLLSPGRFINCVSGFAATLLWIITIRSNPRLFWSSPILLWSLAIVIVVFPLLRVSEHPEAAVKPERDIVPIGPVADADARNIAEG